MTSQVNPNNIDGTYPIAGQDNDSQGFRDNFTNIRNNFTFVKAELEDIQNKAVLKSPLLSGDLDNDFMGNAIVGVALKGWRETVNDIGSLSGSVNIDFSLGNYQKLTLTGPTTLSFTWPSNLSNQYASIKLWVVVTSDTYTITLPNTVTLGDPDTIAGLSGTNPPVISFSAAEISNNTNYLFEFFTFNGSAVSPTIGIIDYVRNRDVDLSGMSITGNLNLDNLSTSGLIGSTGNITTAGNLITTYGVLWAGNGAAYYPTPSTLNVPGTITSGGQLIASATTESTSSTTGSFVSSGGIGIAKVATIAGNIVAASTTESTSSTVGSIVSLGGIGVAKVATIAGNIVAAATTATTSSTTGALVVRGGAGIAANVHIDGNLWVNSGNIRSTSTVANIFNLAAQTISFGNAATNIFMGASTGNVRTAGNIFSGGNIVTSGAAAGVGYAAGAGGVVTQLTSRATGVTINRPSGAITLFSVGSSTLSNTFTVTNSTISSTDAVVLSQKSGTAQLILSTTAVTNGSFNVTFFATANVAAEQPVINFTVIKGAAA